MLTNLLFVLTNLANETLYFVQDYPLLRHWIISSSSVENDIKYFIDEVNTPRNTPLDVRYVTRYREGWLSSWSNSINARWVVVWPVSRRIRTVEILSQQKSGSSARNEVVDARMNGTTASIMPNVWRIMLGDFNSWLIVLYLHEVSGVLKQISFNAVASIESISGIDQWPDWCMVYILCF